MSGRATAAVALAGVAAACGGAPPPPDVAARIEARESPYAEFAAYVEAGDLGLDTGPPSGVLSGLLDQFLDELLLSRIAIDSGRAPPGIGRRRAVAMLGEAVAAEAATAIDPTAVAAYYESNRDRFAFPERVRLSQILVEDLATAERAAARLGDGIPFAQVAAELSQEPAAERGGDQGVLSLDELPPAFAETIFGLAAGETSAIIGADYGFHLFRVTERLPGREVPLAEARDEIEAALAREAVAERMAELVGEARERYNVRVFTRNLPFNYQGQYDEQVVHRLR